ncbi:MAG: GxxExxY protein [Gemmatimonadetes bacterium]|nr:GxxExxY protein [Gemmatimonadota bacterium]|tara:strand:- start:855 stop:1253 length:399 start_codon:yes stop_codon:yes gene_type:complete
MNFEPMSEEEDRIGKAVVDSVFKVHKSLGPGLLETVYESCFCHQLSKRGMSIRRQVPVPVPIEYDGLTFDEGFRLDVLVEDLVICELKAVVEMHPVYKAQILSYLRMSGKRLGFLINFNVPLFKAGVQRVVL